MSARPGAHAGSPQGVDELNTDIRERLARLTQENRQLKLQQQEASQLAAVQALLEAANEQVQTLTQDSRYACGERGKGEIFLIFFMTSLSWTNFLQVVKGLRREAN